MDNEEGAVRPVSRRTALQAVGTAAAVAGGTALLSACGAASTPTNTSSTGGGKSKTAASAGGISVKAATASAVWYTVKGTQVAIWDRGNDCWGTADTCTFLNQKTSGKGTWTVQVVNLDTTNSWAKAGIMARSSLDPTSADVFLAVTVANGVVLQNRDATGDNEGSGPGGDNYSLESNANGGMAPMWLKLTNDGSGNWTGWNSTDGKSWQNQTPSQANPVSLGSSYLVGLAATAHDNTQHGVATFANPSGFSGAYSADLVGTNDTLAPPTKGPVPGA